MTTNREHLLTTLENWRLAGGTWRIVSISDERAVVDRCSYTGEPLERLGSRDPAVIARLRTMHSFRDLNWYPGDTMTSLATEPTGRACLPGPARR